MKVWREANQKPPLGAVVNWDAPANSGLAACWLFNERAGGSFVDSITGSRTPTGLAPWHVDGLNLPTSTTWTWGQPISLVGNYTIIAQLFWSDIRNGSWLFDDAADAAKGGIRDATGTLGYRPYSGAEYATVSNVVPVGSAIVGFTYTGSISRYSVAGSWITLASGLSTNQTNTFTHSMLGATGYEMFQRMCIFARALSADEIAADYAEPYGQERYLVPGLARIFDMGAGGPVIPIGAIRSRFPVLTGGLRT